MRQVGINGFAKSGPIYMFCPVDPAWKSRRKINGTSYAINKDLIGEKKFALSKTIHGFEAADGFWKKSVSPSYWFDEREETWERLRGQIAPQRHFSTHANYLYADGHVVSVPVEQIQQWVEMGINFGLPGRGVIEP